MKYHKKAQSPAPKGYIAALDGLRAFAVLFVIGYHMHLPFAQGGLLGVSLFFVLSGYLITSLLLQELSRYHTIRLRRFWVRRVRRLFPAIVLALCCTALLAAIFNQDALLKVRDDFLASLFWFSNWHYILSNASYFDALGAPSPLQHFWSLAIEEQFYLLWPLMLLAAYKLGISRKATGRIALGLAIVSAISMAVLFNPESDPSRVYYGTDTRAFSLLIGAWAAYLYPAFNKKHKFLVHLGKSHNKAVYTVGLSCSVALLISAMFWQGTHPSLYWGGLVLISILSALLIVIVAVPITPLSAFLSHPVLVWIGKRSYGMYLWHFPIIILFTPLAQLNQMPWWMILVQLATIFIVSELSYTWVESPIRRGALGRSFKDFTCAFQQRKIASFVTGKRGVALCLALGLSCGCAASLLVVAPLHSNVLAERLAEQARLAEEAEAQHQAELAQQKEAQARVYDPVWVGDSVSIGSVDAFKKAFPAGYINAKVSRQFSAGMDIIRTLKEEGRLGKTVVLGLGTNGFPTKLDSYLDEIGSDHEIYLINMRAPEEHQDRLNALYVQEAEKRPNVHVIDWFSVSASHPEWFWQDAIHTKPEGSQAYVDMVAAVIKNNPDIVEAEKLKSEMDAKKQAEQEAQAQS